MLLVSGKITRRQSRRRWSHGAIRGMVADAQQFGTPSLKEIYDLIDIPAIWALFIVSGYRDVLGRSEFHFSKEDVEAFLGQIDQEGIPVSAEPLKLHLSDSDDGPFFRSGFGRKSEGYRNG